MKTDGEAGKPDLLNPKPGTRTRGPQIAQMAADEDKRSLTQSQQRQRSGIGP